MPSKIHQLAADEALASLRTGRDGLSAPEAVRRLREYGPNRIEEGRQAPAYMRLLAEFTQFFSLVLWAAAAMAFAMERLTPGQGMARLGMVIVAVVLISGLFSFWQEYRNERTLAAMRRMLPRQVDVLRGGRAMQVAADDLVPGDMILIAAGARVPADARLIEAFGIRVDNSTLTGESLPVVRRADASAAEEAVHADNTLWAGTTVVAGTGRALVFATGMRTEFGSIAHLTREAGETESPLRRQIARLSRFIIVLALGVGALVLAGGWAMGVPLWQDFAFAIGIIVAMVPEGLLPTLTLALVMATQRMARRRVLIRHLPAVEALGGATVICTDKTGTLTQNRMTVKALMLGAGARAEDTVRTRAQPERIGRYRPFFLAAALCHDLVPATQPGQSQWIGDPMEVALFEFARTTLGALPAWRRIDELPFDADRMRVSVVYQAPQGRHLFCKGALETVLPLCSAILDDGVERAFAPAMRQMVREQEENMAARGLRVLALAYRVLGDDAQPAERELILAGLVGFEDPPRPEVPQAVQVCREAGIRVIMVTGDHPRTALAIARQIGLVRSPAPVVVAGEALRKMSDTQLQLMLDAPEIVFARVRADQKTRIVDALKHKRHVVAVTGDGVNDAPALKRADIGIAMGVAGTDVAREAADMVLLDDNFASIVSAIEEGRAVFDNIRKFLTYILTHNMAELVPYLAFGLFKAPLALTPIQMLAIDMGTDTLTALGLGIERPDPGVMRRPPRARGERLLDWHVALRAYLLLGALEGALALGAFFYVLHLGAWTPGLPASASLYAQATTATLGTIVVLQIVNVFLCRSPQRSVFSLGLFGNRLILAGVAFALAVILPIVYVPAGNEIFGTAALGPRFWLIVAPFGLLLVVADEAYKWFIRRGGPVQRP